MAFAAFPGFLLAALLTFFGLSEFLVGVLIPLSLTAFLPIVLLSMLHEQSWFAVFSNEVWEGMLRASSVVMTFYQGAALLAIIAWMTLLATWFGQPLLAVPQALILVLLTFLFFRLLGWLAHSITIDEDEV